MADLVAEASDVQSMQSPLFFQGGNILIGDDFVLIGVDYLYETLDTFLRYQPVIGMPEDKSKAQDFIVDLFQQTFDRDRKIFFAGTRLRVPDTEKREVTDRRRASGRRCSTRAPGTTSRSSTSTCS